MHSLLNSNRTHPQNASCFASRVSGYILLILALYGFCAHPPAYGETEPLEDDRVRTEMPYQNGVVVLLSDYQDFGNIIRRAEGNVEIIFEDFRIKADAVEYNMNTGEGHTIGPTRFSQGDQWLTCSKSEFNLSTQTGTCYDAVGYTDREFSISGQTLTKTGPDRYRLENASITTCKEENPKWKFTASRSDITLDHTARLRNTFLKIKGIPVFYTPYTILPLDRKKRSSGFTLFETGTSTSKGRVFSQGYYQTLGRSADLTVFGDYFTLRGLALGGTFRARPNPSTRFKIDMYGIRDREDQGGVRLVVDGETRLRGGWRAVSKVNITSSFQFRQAFADNFNKATVSREHANVYLNQNRGNFSTNISFERHEVNFPVRSLVTWKIPSLEFNSRETPVGPSPVLFSFESSIDGVSRKDSQMDTGNIVQRLDVHPHLTLRIPSILGFSIVPTVGVRETYYGAQFTEESETRTVNRGLHRSYTDLVIDFKTPSLVKDFNNSIAGTFRHTIEPFATYRWINGIDDLEHIIRFDENDAIADTNEFEYGIVNRFYTHNHTGAGSTGRKEFMVIALTQKYYFDPSFGGAFQPGHANSFYPLNTVTGFYQTGIERRFSPLSAEVRIRAGNWMNHDLRVDYDTNLHRWRNASLSTGWQHRKVSITGTFFRALQTEPDMFSANQLQGEIEYGIPTRGFSSGLAIRYNFQTGQLLNSRTRLSYAWNCCSVTTEFRQFSIGVRTETQFSFSFWLKGIGNLGNMRGVDTLF
ncbi:MAG: LPS assembly protein LptD [Acidobacteriota bacterium]